MNEKEVKKILHLVCRILEQNPRLLNEIPKAFQAAINGTAQLTEQGFNFLTQKVKEWTN